MRMAEAGVRTSFSHPAILRFRPGFAGCRKSALVVILSEAKNPSGFKTKG
jgi:hypothetical protein